MLHDSLDDEDQLEGWVQSKITKAADYMGTVAHYLEYEMGMHMADPEMDSEEMEVVTGEMIPIDEDY
jgi:hypothetical protein